MPLRPGIYKEDDIDVSILEVIYKAELYKSKLKKYFEEIFEIQEVLWIRRNYDKKFISKIEKE